MDCHPGFVVPFTEQGQSRFSIVLKGHRIFRIVNKHWLQPKSTAALVLNKRVGLPVKSLKPNFDFSPAMKVLDGTFFHYKTILSTLKIFCLMKPLLLIFLS